MNKKPSLSIILIYIGMIYATIPLVPRIRKQLVETFGYSVYDIVYAAFILIGIAALYFIFRKQRTKHRIISLTGIVLLAAIYYAILPNLKYSVEKVHFLEYGFLPFLLIRYLRRSVKDIMIFLYTILLIYLAGLGDETVQWLTPDRVGEIADVKINVYAGLIGIVGCLFIFPEFRQNVRPSLRSVYKTIILGITATCATFFFLYFVHGFGYKIEDAKAGGFYSSFNENDLLDMNRKNKEDKLEPNDSCYFYNEGYRHLFQRDFYDTNHFLAKDGSYYIDWRKSRNENRLLEKYYSSILEKENKLWPSERSRGNPERDLPWTSRVKSTIITGVSFRKTLILFLFLLAVETGIVILIKKYLKKPRTDDC